MTYLPHGATGQDSRDHWRGAATPLSKYIFDRIIKSLFELPAIQNATGPADLLGHGTGTPALAEINSSETVGLTLDANNEGFGVLWQIPMELDDSGAIDYRLLWSNSEAAGTGSALFAGEYTKLVAGTTAIAVGATALDTVIAADVDLAANVINWTPWGTILGTAVTALAITPGDDFLALHFKVTLTTIADATVHAGNVRYYRKYIA